MKCNWCGKGEGKNYTKDKNGMIYYYYCHICVGDYKSDIPFKDKLYLENKLKEFWKKNHSIGFFNIIDPSVKGEEILLKGTYQKLIEELKKK